MRFAPAEEWEIEENFRVPFRYMERDFLFPYFETASEVTPRQAKAAFAKSSAILLQQSYARIEQRSAHAGFFSREIGAA